jgi:hypothetical protein
MENHNSINTNMNMNVDTDREKNSPLNMKKVGKIGDGFP